MTQSRERAYHTGFLRQKALRSIGVPVEFKRFNTVNRPVWEHSAISLVNLSGSGWWRQAFLGLKSVNLEQKLLKFPPRAEEHLQAIEFASSDNSPILRFGNSSPQERHYKPGIVTGCVMFFGGGMLYAVGHILADHAYKEYHQSAFTERTDQFRRQILKYNVMRFGGGALGGIGLVAVLVSF